MCLLLLLLMVVSSTAACPIKWAARVVLAEWCAASDCTTSTSSPITVTNSSFSCAAPCLIELPAAN
jgi:hypothetical protein